MHENLKGKCCSGPGGLLYYLSRSYIPISIPLTYPYPYADTLPHIHTLDRSLKLIYNPSLLHVLSARLSARLLSAMFHPGVHPIQECHGINKVGQARVIIPDTHPATSLDISRD